VDEERARPGSRPIALAVAAVVFVLLVGLPFAVVVVFYLFANVEAILTGTRFGSRTLNLDVFLTGLVLSVGLLAVLVSVAAGLLGRSLAPKRTRR
jgi:hypothetical protein